MQTIFRHGLLSGAIVAFAGRPGPLGPAARESCAELGAEVIACDVEPHDEESVARWAEGIGAPHVLVIDGSGEEGGEHRVPAADAAWAAARALANRCFIPEQRGGKIVLLAPPPGGAAAAAARAALENMARELSIEWARYGITLTAIAPGAETSPAEVGALVAYLASPAGDYYSGCLFELGAAAPG
jgi:citronellol/citronellal dehydrogenase